MAINNDLSDSTSIGFPFLLLAVPVVLPEVLVRFENRVDLHVQSSKVGQHAEVVVGLTQSVILERDSVQRPILQANGLHAAQPTEWPAFELNHRFVVRGGALWED